MRQISKLFAIPACALLLALPIGAQTTAQLLDDPAQAANGAWPGQKLTGTISRVDTEQGVLFVDNNGVRFNIHVNRFTNIGSSGHMMDFVDLRDHIGSPVSVRFTPPQSGRDGQSGDLARSIEVTE